MNLYGQDAEAGLLADILGELECRSVIDVGAERGDMVEIMLVAGAQRVYAAEPHPDNVAELRQRFAQDQRVAICECAVSDHDGDAGLHASRSPSGELITFGHTLLERPATDEIIWSETLSVKRRSLSSLIAAGELPDRVGILKIDTEGHDFSVIRGMGPLKADVVMVEHWTDLPHGLGQCPWTANDMVGALSQRGFNHFGLIAHLGEFVVLQWNSADIEPGFMGNLVFFHDNILQSLLPRVLECSTKLASGAVDIGRQYVQVARERLTVIEDLKQTADERLEISERLEKLAADRLKALESFKAPPHTEATDS